MVGNSTVQSKVDRLAYMLQSCKQESEIKFLTRSFTGKLRIGLAEQSVLTSLAHACVLTQHHVPEAQTIQPRRLQKVNGNHSVTVDGPCICQASSTHNLTMGEQDLKAEMAKAVKAIKAAYNELPVYETLIPALLKQDWETLHQLCSMLQVNDYDRFLHWGNLRCVCMLYII